MMNNNLAEQFLVDEFTQESVNYSQQSVNQSIEKLVLEHGKFVKRFIAKRTWNEQNVDDIYQSTLLEAIKSYPKFRNESQPRTWLCGIAYNIIRNYGRKLNAINCEDLDALESVDFDDINCMSTGNPADIYNREHFVNRVKEVTDTLPDAIKQTFFMIVESGKNYEQAAQSLNVPIGTVRSRIFRAREVLREQCVL